MEALGLVLAIIALGMLIRLRHDVERVARRVSNLEQAGQIGQLDSPSPVSEPVQATPQESRQDDGSIPIILPGAVDPAPAHLSKTMRPDPRPAMDWEKQIGARLMVWVGGAALALAGLFLVRYSIEAGWLSPSVRVSLAMLFGAGMMACGQKVFHRTDIANHARLAQALGGAGVAVLYGALYAAGQLYDLVPLWLCFAAMALVTGSALVMALRQGPMLAAMGLIGGLLTPVLAGSQDPSALLLFLYLGVLSLAAAALAARRGWWGMVLMVYLGGLAWAGFWLVTDGSGTGAALGLGCFAGMMMLGGLAARVGMPDADSPWAQEARVVASGGGMAVMASTLMQDGHVDPLIVGMYFLLCLLTLGLGVFDQIRYRFAPMIGLGLGVVWLLTVPVEPGVLPSFVVMAAILCGLHGAVGWSMLTRSPTPWRWAGLVSASMLAFFGMTYGRLSDGGLAQAMQWPLEIPAFWGCLAFGLAFLATVALSRFRALWTGDRRLGQEVQAWFAATATALISLGCAVEMQSSFLSMAVAAQVPVLVWLGQRLDLPRLRQLAGVMAAVFALLLVPQLLLLMTSTPVRVLDGDPEEYTLHWPLLQLGWPALALAGASWLMQRERDGRLPESLDKSAAVLLGLMVYHLIRHAFHVPDDNLILPPTSMAERAIITNGLFLYGAACYALGRTYGLHAWKRAGHVMAGVAVFRCVWFDLLLKNPLWNAAQLVGAWPLLNALLPAYGLMALACVSWAQVWQHESRPLRARWARALALVLLFTYVSLNIRQFFQGTYLAGGEPLSAELYSYSLAWIVLGLVLVFVGTLRQSRLLRIGSLAVLVVAVAKVFLIDASELGGLWRVVSFLGLGSSLLGLGWFYSRFVFLPRPGPDRTA